jgi:poly(A) polymerase
LLSHPRFRAAFDFLELRLSASNTHADDVAFWREAQLHPTDAGVAGGQGPESDAEMLNDALDQAGDDGGPDAPRKRRRRRRRTGAESA